MDFNLMVIPHRISRNFFNQDKSVINPYATLASITSGCILAALECQSLLLDKILKIHIAGVALKKYEMVSYVSESKFPETIITDHEAEDYEINKIDVKNVERLKLVQHSGKGTKSNKKGGKRMEKKGNPNEEQKRTAQREKEEKERLKKWNEDWEKKMKVQEALDEVQCCSVEGLCLKPRTQSNIWIKVTRDKKMQDIQMAFMHVPVPKPKVPPLPKLVKVEPKEVTPSLPIKKKKEKKKGKGKGKGKKK